MVDLKSNDSLISAINETGYDDHIGWITKLSTFITYVSQADFKTRSSLEFHEKLWEDNPVCSVGMGTVDISDAIKDEAFRVWVAEQSLISAPMTIGEKRKFYNQFIDGIVERLKKYSKRTPWVKIYRIMAAFYPHDFTSIAHGRKAWELQKAIYGNIPKSDRLDRQLEITRRFDDLLGVAADTPMELAKRITLPWIIYEKYVAPSTEAKNIIEESSTGEVVLKPLPAIQRRKGLTSIKGGIASILSAISFVGNGVLKEDLMDYLRSEFPGYASSSLSTLFNILKNEFFVIEQKGDQITLTNAGEELLDTSSPEYLIPILLTRILGVDNVIVALRDKGSMKSSELYDFLKEVNPGWTTAFAPNALLKWLRDFDLVSVDTASSYALTEDGKLWAGKINWIPQVLMVDPTDLEVSASYISNISVDISRIDIQSIAEEIRKDNAFDSSHICALHFGLWSHQRRHFAVLAGLSGSGKTLLAQSYGLKLASGFSETPEKHCYILAVQPGWYDPSALFGYVNPLMPDSYVRPPFLDFVLSASQNPNMPYVVILDEMNLSHPEQYFAPVLSAMESGGDLVFHNEGEFFDGVPAKIPYPNNLVIIGTLNMDETTHGLSDKVLDRAFTLEFWDINLDDYPRWKSQKHLDSTETATIKNCLKSLLDVLKPVKLHFGWRTVDDILGYLDMAKSQGCLGNLNKSLDDIIYARVLPKLRGSDSFRISEALKKTRNVLMQHDLNKSRQKVDDLIADLAEQGSMRFWR